MSVIYPNEFLRGISTPNDITPEGYVKQAAFRFDDYKDERGDDFRELSINWLDDEDAIAVLLNQVNVKKGVPQFRGGYCRLQLGMLRLMLKDYFHQKHLAYERRPIPEDLPNGIAENKYHGNILMKRDIDKAAITNIQSSLAGLAGLAIKR